MSAPLITIGITYYQAADTITRAVESALAQTWRNIEIIIVDDCSNDDHGAKLQELARDYDQVTVITHDVNKGVAASRNTIISNAKGTFIAFFDDDDVSAPDRLERQYERIMSYELAFADGAPVLCHSARTQYYPNGEQRHEVTIGACAGVAPYGHDVALRILTGKPQAHILGSTATCSQMARRSTYTVLGGFDESFRRCEDTEFNVRAALQGAHFPGIDTPLVTQTMTLASEKKITNERGFAIALLAKHQDFINQYSSFTFHRDWLVAKYHFLQKQYFRFAFDLFILGVTHPVLTMKRAIWGLPKLGFNMRTIRFHHDKA